MPINPPSSKGHQFVHAITNYFSKQAEANPPMELKTSHVIKFLRHHIIYHLSISKRIVHDSKPQFISQVLFQLCDKFSIQNIKLTAYNPMDNSLAKCLIRLSLNFSKRWFHQASETGMRSESLGRPNKVRTPTGDTLHSLVCGCKVILPLEI